MSKKDDSGAGCFIVLVACVANLCTSWWLVNHLTTYYGTEDPVTWWIGLVVSLVLLQTPAVLLAALATMVLLLFVAGAAYSAVWLAGGAR